MTREQLLPAIQGVPPGGPRIKVALMLLRKPQRQIAKRLKVSQSTFSLIVTSRRDADAHERQVIADSLGLAVGDLWEAA
jgi:hypothetical protein